MADQWENLQDLLQDICTLNDFGGNKDLGIELNHDCWLNDSSNDSVEETVKANDDSGVLSAEPPQISTAIVQDRIISDIEADMVKANVIFESDVPFSFYQHSAERGTSSSHQRETPSWPLNQNENDNSGGSFNDNSWNDSGQSTSQISETGKSNLSDDCTSEDKKKHVLSKRKRKSKFRQHPEFFTGKQESEEWKPMKREDSFSVKKNEFPRL